MNRIKYVLFALLLTAMSTASLTVSSDSARAASVYDDIVTVTPTLSFYESTSSTTFDISTDWYSEILEGLRIRCEDRGNTSFCPGYHAMENMLDGYWEVWIDKNNVSGSNWAPVRMFFTENTGESTCSFLTVNGSPRKKCERGTIWNIDSIGHFPNGQNSQYQTLDGIGIYGTPTTISEFNLTAQSGYDIFRSTYPTTYPSGYDGTVLPESREYVAMGDSFSSGEGNPNFEFGTDVGSPTENRCHRSLKAYPRLLQIDARLNFGLTKFVACSGATTTNVFASTSGTGGWNEPAQTAALSTDTELVTITIGGNDVEFGDYVLGCVVGLCGLGTTDYSDMMSRINDPDFLDSLEVTYKSILTHAPNADIYVLDYPYMVDPTGADGYSCAFYADMSGATQVTLALNGVISDAIDNVQAESGDYSARLRYMPTNFIDSPFEGKHLCTDDPAGSSFNAGVSPPNEEYSFHPNEKGHQNYEEIMADYLS